MIIYVFLLLSFSILLSCNHTKQNGNKLLAHGFGPYVVSIRFIKKCEPQGKLDLLHMPKNGTLIIKKVNRTDQIFEWEYTYLTNICFKEIYVEIESERRGGIFDLEYKKKAGNPCNNLVTRYIWKHYYKADSKCCIKKGVYSGQLNPNLFVHDVFTSIQYNTYIFTMGYNSHIGQLGCIKLVVDIKPVEQKLKRKKPALKLL